MTDHSKAAHPAFSIRMQQACDGNPKVPPLNFGRLGWIVKELENRSGVTVTKETVRKWFAGDTFPRSKIIPSLAQILGVDPVWLATGHEPELSSKEMKIRDANADGAVNLVAGIIAMSGGHPAFPQGDDEVAKTGKIDLYAVIRGAQYRFHVTSGYKEDDSWKFVFPVEAVGSVIIGVTRVGEFCFEFLEIDSETIETQAKRKSGVYEITKTPESVGWRKINTFGARL